MDHYLVESPHAGQNCRNVGDLVNRAGYLNHFDWGCMGSVYCGWAIIEVENEPHARLVVPPLSRGQARMFKIVKFSQLMLNSRHQQ